MLANVRAVAATLSPRFECGLGPDAAETPGRACNEPNFHMLYFLYSKGQVAGLAGYNLIEGFCSQIEKVGTGVRSLYRGGPSFMTQYYLQIKISAREVARSIYSLLE